MEVVIQFLHLPLGEDLRLFTAEDPFVVVVVEL